MPFRFISRVKFREQDVYKRQLRISAANERKKRIEEVNKKIPRVAEIDREIFQCGMENLSLIHIYRQVLRKLKFRLFIM